MFGNLASIKQTRAAICVYEIRMAWIFDTPTVKMGKISQFKNEI